MGSPVTLIDTGLKQLIKAFSGKLPQARIGILGSSSRTGGTNNATIGAAHEFGTSTLPIRSFLRQPIAEHMQAYLQKGGAFDPEKLKKVMKEGSIREWVQKLAITAEQIVADGFDTEGFGQWQKWKSKSYSNSTGKILIDTHQLRDSITSEVQA